jgi:putative esterase
MSSKNITQSLLIFIIFGFCVLYLTPQKTFAATVSDNFNRSDGGLGSNWTTMAGTTAPQIVSSHMQAGANNTVNSAFWAANTFGNNQFAQATFPNILGGQDGPGVAVRMANSRGYFLWFNNSSSTVSIYRMDNATTWSSIATSGVLTISNTDVWRIEVEGSTISGYQNGNLVVQKTDGTYTTGSPGVWLYYTVDQLDDWSGGDLPTKYSLGGTVSGLIGKVVIQNGSTTLNLTNNGTFAFNSALEDGTSYNVTVQTNPTGQTCTLSNGSGSVNAASVTNISISCSGNPLSTSATDNFNRSDGSLGSNWTDGSEGGLQVSSQQVIGTSGSTSEDYRTAETYSGNQYSQIEVGSVTGSQFIGPTVRMQNNGQDCYVGLYDFNNGSPYLQIFKRNGGSFSALTGQLSVAALTSGTTLKLMVVGDTLSFLINGVEKQAVYDNSLTGGAPGIMAFQTPTADNWSGGNAGYEFHYLSTDGNGVESYDMISQNNGHGAHVLRVLRPTNPTAGVAHNFLILLPVEPEEGTTFGDGINYLRTLDAQNQYNLTIIEPAFVQDPWYADNPLLADSQYETFMTAELQPWIKSNLATTGNEQTWLMGFSKSGIGGMDLFFKHSDLYNLVASWDWPADNASYDQFGTSSSSQYGTDANFQENYRLTTSFIDAHDNSSLQSQNRIWIGGYNAFQADVSDFDGLLTAEGIMHSTETPTLMTHAWDSGWVPLALSALSQDSTNLSVTPTPTPSPTTTPTNSSNSSGSSSNSSGSTSPPANPNAHPNWAHTVDAGPNYVGTNHFITNSSLGQSAAAFIGNNATTMDISLTIEQLAGDALINELPVNPFPWIQGLNTVSEIFHFNAVSAFNGYLANHFNEPVTVVLPYDPAKLNGIDPHRLRIAQYDTTTNKWIVLENNTVLDVVSHTVANTTTDLTYFAVVYPTKIQNSTTRILGASATNHNVSKSNKNSKNSSEIQKVQIIKSTPTKTCFLFVCW